jgi:hypothetical protein
MKRTIITVCAVALLGGVGVEFYRLIEQRIELYRIEAQRKQILLEAEKGWQREQNDQEAKKKAYYTPLPGKRFSQYDAERLADYFDSHSPTPSPTPKEEVSQINPSLIPHSVQ